MHKNDWSLIFFTLLSQLSVGIILGLTVLNFVSQAAMEHFQDGAVILSPQFFALATIVVATFISFLHLGYPGHAFNAANNLASSWLSREIIGIGLFGFGVLLIFLQFCLGWESALFQNFVFGFGAISGLILIYSMARIYMVNTIPTWNTWFTPFHFFMSALVLGLMVVLGFLVSEPASIPVSVILLRIAAALLLIQLLAAFLYKHQLIKMEHKGISPPDFVSGSYHNLYLIRLFIIFISALFTAYLSLKLPSIEVIFTPLIRLYTIVFLLIVVEEIIGRFMFYAGYYRVGV